MGWKQYVHCVYTVEPAKGKMQKWLLWENAEFVALRRFCYWGHESELCVIYPKPNIYDIKVLFLTLTNKSIMYEENMTY